jgi:adenosylcobinamide-GDP ribazoletransferase
VKKLAAAFKFLTIWGCISELKPEGDAVGSAAGLFPVTGLFLGLLLALTNYSLAAHVDPRILNLILIALLIATTGAQPLTGLKDTFDTIGSASMDRAPRMSAIWGLTAVVLVILFKSAAMDSMDELLTLSLLLTPVLARWVLVIFLYGVPSRFDENARLIAEGVTTWPVILSTAATLALAVYFLGRKGLWIGLAISLFALSIRGLLIKRHDALSQAHLGAAIELSEALSLVLLASL